VVWEQYKKYIDKDLFDFLVNLDPTPQKKYDRFIVETFIRQWVKPFVNSPLKDIMPFNMKFYSHGSYINNYLSSEKVATQYDKSIIDKTMSFVSKEMSEAKRFVYEDSSKVTDALITYTKLKNKNLLEPAYINPLEAFKTFQALVKFSYANESKLPEDEEGIKEEDREKWYEDDEWLVVVPLTYKASCKYGANTKWCTTDSKTDAYFKNYSSEAPLIIVTNKQRKLKPDNLNKVQFNFGSEVQMKDAADDELHESVGIEGYLGLLPKEVRYALYTHTQKFLFSPNKVETVTNWLSDQYKRMEIVKAMKYTPSFYTVTEKGDSLSDIIEDKSLITTAIVEYGFNKGFWDDITGEEGRIKPWEYIDEEPENIEDAEKCENCEGKKYYLPLQLSPEKYSNIRNDIKDKVQNFYIPMPTVSNPQIYNRRGSPEQIYNFAKENNIKCSYCDGTGYEEGRYVTHNVDYYSEDQIERAEYKAQEGAMDYYVDEAVRDIWSDHFSSYRGHSKETLEGVFDYVWNNMKDIINSESFNIEWFKKNALNTLINFLNLGLLEL